MKKLLKKKRRKNFQKKKFKKQKPLVPSKHAAAHLRQGLDDRQVQPQRLCLRADHAPGAQSGVHGLEKGPLEEDFRGPDGVGGVDDDRVVAPGGGLGHKVDAVADVHGDPRVGEAQRHFGKVLLGDVDDHAVDLGEVDVLDALVPRHFP